jgi:putative flippase GtrA
MGIRTNASVMDFAGQAVRFAVVGFANTVATGAIFYVLALSLPASVAYTIAFGLGIGFAVAVTPRFVFRVRPPRKRRAAYAAWYVLVYVIGLGLVFLLDNVLGAHREQIVVLTVATTAALSFLGGRVVLSSRPSRQAN